MLEVSKSKQKSSNVTPTRFVRKSNYKTAKRLGVTNCLFESLKSNSKRQLMLT